MYVPPSRSPHGSARHQSRVERTKIRWRELLPASARRRLCARHGRCAARHPPGASSCFTNAPGPDQEDKMTWIVIVALAVVAFGLVKARRHRNAAAGTGHE